MPLCLWRPNIATALEYARDRALPVQLTFDGRPREAGPLLCTVTFTARDITVLSTAEPLIPAELKGGECRIYFKPDIEANPEEARDGQEESGKLPSRGTVFIATAACRTCGATPETP